MGFESPILLLRNDLFLCVLAGSAAKRMLHGKASHFTMQRLSPAKFGIYAAQALQTPRFSNPRIGSLPRIACCD